MTSTPALETDRAVMARSVSKTFGTTRALDAVDILVRPGTVHALVGENGAGKSTLAKILAGIEAPDAGTMTIGDTAYAPRDRAEAKARGVNMVPQHLSLVGELSLLDNFLLVSPRRLLRRRAAHALLSHTLERAEVDVDLTVPTRSLTQAHRQLGEIVVALAEGATTLILDEPTASLGPREVGGLFTHLRSLCESGTAIVLITHRLEEVGAVADDVSVLSHGRLVHHGPAADLSPQRVARLMVGELPPPAERALRSPGDPVISLREVTAVSTADADLDAVSLEVRAGEIVGVAGVAGSGQNTLMDVLAGLTAPQHGSFRIDDLDAPRAVDLLARGVAWIPEERSDGLVPTLSLGDTLSLYDTAAKPGASRSKPRRVGERPDAAATLRAFDVRPAIPTLAAGGLSGGNQQKLLVSRELGAEPPRVVLAYGPTQGLDLRAAQSIRERLVAAAEAGAAVLVASHDLEELLHLADRVVVMFSGRIAGEWPISEVTTDKVGAAMAGLTAVESPDAASTDDLPDTTAKEPS